VSNKKVLIVEDDTDGRLEYQALLKANDYDTFFAADSLTALTEAHKRQPDLIILDLGLPNGDAFIVLERLLVNAYLAVIPVIVVSAHDIHGNQESALKAGAKAYVRKPWNDDELLAVLSRLLAESKPSVF
jgi:DNA-binding response OmpR family regulator